jgi:hypothetical protein
MFVFGILGIDLILPDTRAQDPTTPALQLV